MWRCGLIIIKHARNNTIWIDSTQHSSSVTEITTTERHEELEFSVVVEINVDIERLAVTTSFWREQVLVKSSVHAHRCTRTHLACASAAINTQQSSTHATLVSLMTFKTEIYHISSNTSRAGLEYKPRSWFTYWSSLTGMHCLRIISVRHGTIWSHRSSIWTYH